MVAGSSPGTSEMASVSMRAAVALRSRPPLMREMWRRTVFISWMSAPHLSSPRVSAVLAASSMPAPAPPTARRRRRRTARAPDRRRVAARPAPACARPPRRCRHQVSDDALRDPDVCGTLAARVSRAVRRGGEAGDTVEDAQLAIVLLGDRGHGGRRLAGADHDDAAAVGRRRQVRRQADVGMGGGDGGLVQGQQPGAHRRCRCIACHGFSRSSLRLRAPEHVQVMAAAVKRLEPAMPAATPARLATLGRAHYSRRHG